MKVFAFAFLLLCIVMVVATPCPIKKKAPPKCDIMCPAVYAPVCGGVPGDKSIKPKAFGNECVMLAYNCEHNSNLVKIPEDQCANAGGVRLS